MRLRVFLGAVLLTPAIALAEPPPRAVVPPGQASLYDVVAGPANDDGYQLGMQLVPAGEGTSSAVAQSRTIYLNKNGITLQPGLNDSRLNQSTVVTQQTAMPAWNVSAADWAATVSCIREIFSPFDITIVDADPGNVPHIEAVFGGTPTQLGMSTTLAGVSPFTTDCAVIENSIVFTFTGAIGNDPRLACEVQAQEIAHSYGLDHVLLSTEVMTYLPYDGRRWFQNQNASCGEDKARPCGLNGSVCRQAQNSVSMMIERVGMKIPIGDAVAPSVGITSPRTSQTVPQAFAVAFTASDNTRVAMASLYVDGVPRGSIVLPPYSLPVSGLAEGPHTLRVVVTDGLNEKSHEVAVTVQKGAAAPDGQDDDVVGGCAAGGGGGAAGAGLPLVLAALARRRRPARRRG